MSGFQWATLLVVLGSVGLFSVTFGRLVGSMLRAKPSWRWDHLGRRVVAVIRHVFLHERLLRQPWPGIIHVMIFWGFVILTLGTLEWIFEGLTGGRKFWFLGPLYGPYLSLQDAFNGLVLLAVLGAVYRRLFVKPKRMADNSTKSRADAYFILGLIGGLVVTNLLTHSISIANGTDTFFRWQPFATLLSNLWDPPVSESWYHVFWWAHLLIVFFFLNYLPFSKHLHVIVAGPNVFFSKMDPRGGLTTPDLSDETVTTFGAEKAEQLTWKNLLDSYACTECGRCNEYCPTATTGKALRPKTLMIELRAAIGTDQDLVPAVFSDQFVWDCTTCGACVESCPVLIDHVDSIVEMRRALVLNKGSNPSEATNVFRNWEASSNPWGFSESSRQEWLLEKGVPQYQADGDFEFLYYIGCAGSFDDRNKKVVESVVKILQNAGIKFGILGREERCNGETARRLGNEWLAQQMIKLNQENLEKYKVKKILTSCPHCFNTLKNEYPEFGGHYEVQHHSDFIQELIAAGRIQVQKGKFSDVTYHDSCYIGRYNGIYDAPRDIIEAVTGEPTKELKRSKEKGFCCGAGGGRMWLEETTGTRINQNRTDEILDSKAKTVCVACPFCMTMISDGLKSRQREDIPVKDLSELVAESL